MSGEPEKNIFDISSLLNAASGGGNNDGQNSRLVDQPSPPAEPVKEHPSVDDNRKQEVGEKQEELGRKNSVAEKPVPLEDSESELVVPKASRSTIGGRNRKLSDAVNAVLSESTNVTEPQRARLPSVAKTLQSTDTKAEKLVSALQTVAKQRMPGAHIWVIPHMFRAKGASVRQEAIATMGVLATKECVPPLLRCLLESQKKNEKDLAAVSLAKCKDIRVVRPLLNYGLLSLSERAIALEALAQMGEEIIPELENVAKDDSDPELTVFAIQTLSKFETKPSRLAVYRFVQHENEEIATAAIGAFAAIARPKEAKGLYHCVADSRPAIRLAGVRGLIRLPNPTNIRALARIELDTLRTDVDLARSVAKALLVTGHKKATSFMVRLSVLDDSEVLKDVAIHFGEVNSHDSEAMRVLNRLAVSENEEVRVKALLSLTRLGDIDALPTLIQSLKSDSASVRRQAIAALGKIEKPQAVKELGYRLLNDPNIDIREASARALAKPGRVKAIRILEKALADDSLVRRQVINSLGVIGGEQVMPLLHRGLNDAAPDVRVEAINAIVKVDAAGEFKNLAKMLHDYDRSVVQAAEKALKSLGGWRLHGHKFKKRLGNVKDALKPRQFSPKIIGAIALAVLVLAGGGYGSMLLFGPTVVPAPDRGKLKQVRFGPDGKLFVVSDGGWLEIWETDAEVPLQTNPHLGVAAIDFDAENRLNVVTSDSLLELSTDDIQQPPKTLMSDLNRVLDISVGKQTAIVCSNEILVRKGEEAPQKIPSGSVGFVCAAQLPDGEVLIAGLRSAFLTAYEVASGKKVTSAKMGAATGLVPTAIAVSPDGNWIAAASNRGSISIRSISGFKSPVVWEINKSTKVRDIVFTPDSKALVVADSRPAITVWPIETGEPRKLEGFDGEDASSVTISPDGKRVAACTDEDRAAWILDFEDGSLLQKLPVPAR